MNREQLAKSQLIKEFIRSKNRTPTQSEILFLYREFLEKNPTYLKVGLNGGTPYLFDEQVTKESSSEKFNIAIEQYLLEQKNINKLLLEKEKESEYLFRLYNSKFSEELNNLKRIERNINKNLLIHSKDDIYTNGIVESFQDYEKVDFDKSKVYMMNGKVTLDFKNTTGETFTFEELSYRISSRSGNEIIHRNLNSISSALKEDGDFFKVLAFSDKPNETIDFYIDVDFPESKSIDTLKFTTQAIECNSKIDYQCYYSQDEVNYIEVFESRIVIDNNENYVEINKDNIKSIRLILSKNAYDYRDGDKFVYIFNMDYFGGVSKAFDINKESVLYLGPYEILDEDEEPINFSMATCKGGTCCIVPDQTSIDFYLSKDNVNWYKADYNSTGKSVVQFEDSKETFDGNGYFKKYEDIDSGTSKDFIIENYDNIEINLLAHQRLLNLYVEEKNFKNIIKPSLKIKRNFCNKGNQETYSAKEGWVKNDRNYYCTKINIKEPEGRYFNFGSRSCLLNNKQVSGKVFIPYGVHDFKTSEENWYDLNISNERSLNNEKQLELIDRLYPYNHKYIVEGFKYNSGFNGKKIYKGASEIFGFELKEISNQRFLTENSLEKFTFVKANFTNANNETVNAVFIMVNIKENSSEGKIEKYALEGRKRNAINENGSNNKLYIKAILKSSNRSITPKIDQIQVRVI